MLSHFTAYALHKKKNLRHPECLRFCVYTCWEGKKTNLFTPGSIYLSPRSDQKFPYYINGPVRAFSQFFFSFINISFLGHLSTFCSFFAPVFLSFSGPVPFSCSSAYQTLSFYSYLPSLRESHFHTSKKFFTAPFSLSHPLFNLYNQLFQSLPVASRSWDFQSFYCVLSSGLLPLSTLRSSFVVTVG